MAPAVLALGARGLAQDAEQAPAQSNDYGARARVSAPIASTHTADPSASGTTIDVRERSSAAQNVAEVVSEAPGTHVQNTGGFGAFSGVALRGAGMEHTTVLLGDLPLNTADTGPFDLSLMPLAVLDSVEIYRGGAPIWWSEGAIGGVLRLVPSTSGQSYLRADTTYGSFGRAELGATTSVVRDTGSHHALFAHVDVAHADNDYKYVADQATLFNTAHASASADDVTLRQRNAAIDAGNGLAHVGIDALGGRLHLLTLAHERGEGIPGPLAAPTWNVHRHLLRTLGAASWTKEALAADGERRYRLQVLTSGNYQNNQVTDLAGTLYNLQPAAPRDVWTRGYVKLAGSFALTPFLEPTAVASFARDDYRPDDPLAFIASPRPSGRSAGALALEARLHGRIGHTRVEVRPSVRSQWSHTSLWATGDIPSASTHAERDENVSTYRVAAVVAPTVGLAFSTSVSSGARLPSVLELFGDRVFQESSPTLRPERSRTVDLSTVVRGHAGDLEGSAEVRGFALFIDDLINYRRTSLTTVKPYNVASARSVGVELGAQLHYGRHLALSGSATVMDARDQSGQGLPLRPPLHLYARPELRIFPGFADSAAVFTELEHVSFVYLDERNSSWLAGRTVVSLGCALKVFGSRATLSARVRNLFNVAAVDVLSRPLPGIEGLVSLAVQETVP